MKIRKTSAIFLYLLLAVLFKSCMFASNSNDEMVNILASISKQVNVKENTFYPGAELAFFDSVSKTLENPYMIAKANYYKGSAFLKLGREKEAIAEYEKLLKNMDHKNASYDELLKNYAIACMRLGERENCVRDHSAESCVIPIRGMGIHKNKNGSTKAIDAYTELLTRDPLDYESRWLMNVAYMTLGEYPQSVPKKWLIPDLNKDKSGYALQPFVDAAPGLGLNMRNTAGGVIVEDFNNDGYLDIITSDWSLEGSMHYFKNDTHGRFIDVSELSDLSRFKGGLNIIQADYDNDGDVDVFVLRGAWMGKFGEQPNSLLRNNGDDTFTDVTIESGLFSKKPTQAGVWRDFNNDGWLDLYIGYESFPNGGLVYQNELFINNKKGGFVEVAGKANCQIIDYVKGVTAADYNNDGREDIFLSTIGGSRVLLKNMGNKDGIPQFENVTQYAGLADVVIQTFPTWFWDYDNDGWQDIFVCGYQFGKSIAHSAGTEAMGVLNQSSKMYLYHNNKDGTFTNVSEEAGLGKSVFAMGSNFGDIDNDGYLDMYLGTGNPEYKSLVPNRLFKNTGDGRFADVTVSARVGNLQKGHAVAINDMDNDGDQDIFIEVGGAYVGDAYNNSLYLNPGQNDNRWISLRLEGTEVNRSAIGTNVKISFRENGVKRVVHRNVNSGGSFGSGSLRRDIGIGQATLIDEIEVSWPGGKNKKQVFKNVKPNQFLKIKQGSQELKSEGIKETVFKYAGSNIPICEPLKMNSKMPL
jgi:tetratricopeptide (TPR) repeat protein